MERNDSLSGIKLNDDGSTANKRYGDVKAYSEMDLRNGGSNFLTGGNDTSVYATCNI